MLRNYLKTALRTLRKHPVYTAINTGGLAVAIAAALLLALYVQHELSYDDFHAHAERTARIVETRTTPEGTERVAETAGPVGPAAVQEVPGVKDAVRVTHLFRVTVERGGTRFYVGDYLITEPSFFDVFSFAFARGTPETALREPETVVLTHDAARRYFGDANPIGKTLSVEGFGETTVTGVLEPLPETSHLQFSMLFPFATLARQVEWFTPWMSDWAHDFRTITTYVRLDEGASRNAVAGRLSLLMADHTPDAAMPSNVALQPLTDIHLYSADIQGGFNARPGSPTYVLIFGLIAAFIVGIAAINYMNLATARAADRRREVGMRKAIGANRGQLVGQFLGEAVLLCTVAFVLGLLLARAALPAFNTLAGTALALENLAYPMAIGLVGAAALGLGLLAGAYPAFVLSRYEPASVLKSAQSATLGGAAWLRRTLVVTQFALSIGLIAATLVVAEQLDFVQSKRLGFTEKHLVAVDINSNTVRQNMETMKAEMQRHPAVQHVSVSSRIPGDWKTITEVQINRPGASDDAVRSAYFIGADDSFLDTYEISLQAGRNFDAKRGTDTTAVLLNETAVRTLGLSDPIGATVRVPQVGMEGGGESESALELHVIGVVEDFHFHSLYQPIQPLLIGYHNNPVDTIDYFTARVNGTQMSAAIDHLRSIGERFDPSHPFEYNVLDDRIAAKYATDRRVGRIFGAAAGLAILIACFGLFGLAAYTAQRRRKEIGIRKALGATATHVIRLLTTDFVKLVGIGFVVATPVVYLLMQRWLQDFAYHVDLGVGAFALAGAAALLIALLTVTTQAWRAARTDPATVLQSE